MQLPDTFSYFMEGTNGCGVLLVHGLTGAPAEMKLVAKQLNRAGYSIYAPLLAGHGTDKKTLVKTTWQEWRDSVSAAAQQLQKHTGNPVHAAGICVGGKLAMLAAHEQPGLIESVAIYSPCFGHDGWNVPFYYPLLSANIGWLSHVPFLDRLSFGETETIGIKDDRLRRMMQSLSAEGVLDNFPGRALVQMHRLGKHVRKTLPQMTTPTLILHAPEDDLSHPRNARIIDENIAGPHALHWIEDSYHMLHVDRQHKQVADLTADFFAAHTQKNDYAASA